MTGRRMVLGAAAVVLLGVVAAATRPWLLGPWEEWPEDGPAKMPFPHGYVVRYDVGEVFTDGWEVMEITGDETAVLRRVELVGPGADHFQVIGVLMAGKDRLINAWQTAPGFPPRMPRRLTRSVDLPPHPLGPLKPALGATLPTGRLGVALEIGMKVVKPGLAIRTGVRVYYTVGSEKYSIVMPGSIANCPKNMTGDQCQDAYLALRPD